jgi:hypothetical protein
VGVQVAAASLGQSSVPALTGLLAGQAGLEWVPRVIVALALGLFAVNALLARASERERAIAAT